MTYPINKNAPSKGRLLVVDDSSDSLGFLSTMLTNRGYDVSVSSGGSDALEMIKNDHPDIILLDIRMPLMDGFEVCRELKSNDAVKDIPVIFISALDHIKDKIMAFKTGGVDYITKPFQIPEVLARIDTHLSLRNMQKKHKTQNAALKQEIFERRKAENALQKAYEEMEARVLDRTKDLAVVNTNLLEEIKERKEAEKALKESEKTLRNLTAHLINAQEEERKRISIELHDELGQALMTLKLRIRSVQKALMGRQKMQREDLEHVLTYIDDVMENTRRLSKDLSPSILEDLGLQASLEWLLNETEKNHGIKVSKKADEIQNVFRKEDKIIVFRIFQEALTNIAKHSGATKVDVLIHKHFSHVFFSIIDNGHGFDAKSAVEKKHPSKGLGLFAMKERIRMVNGSFDIVSEINKGAALRFSIPIK